MKKQCLIAIYIIFLWSITQELITNARALPLQNNVSNGDVIFNANARSISLAYSRTQDQSDYVFFQDELIELEIFLRNETNQSIPISAREGRWWEFMSVKMYRNTIAIPRIRVGIISVATESKAHPTGNVSQELSVLYPGELVKTAARIKLDNSFRLPKGKYKLELLLNPIRLGGKFPHPNRIIPAILSFEVREVKSRADLLDYYL